jgi:hypothetical protein
MKISKHDYVLIHSILRENIEDFISAFNSGASLRCASGRPRYSTNPQIQAMIEFALAADAIQLDRQISTDIFRTTISPVSLRNLINYTSVELQRFLKEEKEKRKTYRPL